VNTQTHVLMGAALFGSAASSGQTLAAAAGGLAPDLPMIAMVLGARWIMRHSPREIFGTLYFSPSWQGWLAPWHSIPFWVAGSATSWAAGTGAALAFAASGLAHVVCDFFLHHTDAHRQFWPFSDWRFRSPLSYWDNAHHGRLIRALELVLAASFSALLIYQHASPTWLVGLGAILALYAMQIAYFLRALG
jgi:membrane-bound metal-dependent hydrolase YbcI (DUF457 family)